MSVVEHCLLGGWYP